MKQKKPKPLVQTELEGLEEVGKMIGCDAIQHQKKRIFLAAYARSGNISVAAEAAGIDRSTHYRWLDDPVYAEVFEHAKEAAADYLEKVAWERATQGIRKPVYQGGKLVGYTTDTSDTLLIFLLKGLRPEKYVEKLQLTGANGGKIQVELSMEEVEKLYLMLREREKESTGDGQK